MDALQKLGIDGWSVVLYILNTGLLIGVLTKLLYKPLIGFLDQRRETIKRNLEETEALRIKYEAEVEHHQREARDLVQRMQAEIAATRAYTETQAKELMDRADQQREQMLGKARQQIEEAKAKLLKEAEQETQKRIERVVLHVLREHVPSEQIRKSVDQSWKEVMSAS